MTENLLAGETSPYLLQHKDNLVHWQAWSDDAFAEAKRLDKPILLSVGYAACHWCHVMAHESFEDESTARVMNDLFVNIKVDREERPDVDNIYQTALALMDEHGGWPLTMFLTPAGEPFWGGTYFPPTPRFGRPGFPEVLARVAETFRGQRERVDGNATALREALTKTSTPQGGNAPSLALLDETATALLQVVDPIHGGTMGAPKFPQPCTFRFLWHAYCRTGSPLFRQAVTLTLDEICQGGIYDHLGGGFARYSTDEHWLVPHFEKMLYDNGLLVELLAEVWRDTGEPLYAARIAETIEWLAREMAVADDAGRVGFASALDADSEGEEGKYYVWTQAEIDALLGDRAAAFKDAYDVTPYGNWEGHTILNRSHHRDGFDADADAAFDGDRRRLLATREKRVPPGRDDKVLADWNGLMIAGLARAAMLLDRPEWLDPTRSAFDFVVANMTDGDRLLHAWRDGPSRHPAVLDDYANMARAALMLLEATAEATFLDHARAWVEVADRHYRDDADGAYFLNADDTTDVITRPKTVHDNAVPSGNGTMVEVLARLHLLTGDAGYRDRAAALVRTFCADKTQVNAHQPVLLTGWEVLDRAVQVVVVGDAGDDNARSLVHAAFAASPPTRVVSRFTPQGLADGLPAGHPAAGKGPVDGRPAAYVCVGPTCGLPATTADELRQRLAEAARP